MMDADAGPKGGHTTCSKHGKQGCVERTKTTKKEGGTMRLNWMETDALHMSCRGTTGFIKLLSYMHSDTAITEFTFFLSNHVPRGSKVTNCLVRSDVLACTIHNTKTGVLPMTPEKRLD